MPPKPTPLFHPEFNEEADKAIQEVEDAKPQLTHLNMGLIEFNWRVEAARAAKAKQQQLAEEQAEKDWHMETEEKAAREWQEQLAELAQINLEVSPK